MNDLKSGSEIHGSSEAAYFVSNILSRMTSYMREELNTCGSNTYECVSLYVDSEVVDLCSTFSIQDYLRSTMPLRRGNQICPKDSDTHRII